MAAEGIHDDPTLKLGRRPASDKPALHFGDHLIRAAFPAAPLVDTAPHLTYPMDLNDKIGCCVVAGLDHALQTVGSLLGVPRTGWTQDEIVALYKTQNPGFVLTDPNHGPASNDDGGMLIQDFLAFLAKRGDILGFAKVNQTDETLMKAATYLGLAIVTGQDMTVSQQSQPVWDYVSGDRPWGGHCTTTVGYFDVPDLETCVTWGRLTNMTPGFVQHQMTEAWFVLTQAHVDHPGFRDSFDLAGFAAAFTQLTGRPFPVPVPAPAPPAPAPAPAPVPVPVPPTPAPAPVPAPVGYDVQHTPLGAILADMDRRIAGLEGKH